MQSGTNTSGRQRGVSLIETLMVAAIVTITAGAVMPDFSSMLQRQRLQGAVAQLQTELQYARSLAVAERQAVRFSFRANASQSCYAIHTGAAGACQCSGQTATCTGGAVSFRTVGFDSASGLRATSNSGSFLFDPVKGTVTPTATIAVVNNQGDTVRLVVNIMGRVRSCTPTGLPGYKPC